MKKKYILLLIGFILILPVGITFSRYVVENVKNYIMEANNFFFSSDKLKHGGISYEINNWGGTSNIEIEFELNNHKNNILTSDTDIEYDLEVNCPSGFTCSFLTASGVIQKAEKTDSYTLRLVPTRPFNDNESATVSITATSSSPYRKILSATFVITVGRRGIDYEITDSINSPYLIFRITNALDKYKVITPFGDYTAGHIFTTEEYLALSNENKAKCASAVITLTFNPQNVILDTTSDILKTATYTTSRYNNIDYINSITFNIDVLTSMEIRFYKIDSTQNYTYPGTGVSPIITFNAV